MSDKQSSNGQSLSDDALDKVVGGAGPSHKKENVVPEMAPHHAPPPPHHPEPGPGHHPPPVEPHAGDLPIPDLPHHLDRVPPPHPDGYVNEFILPLYDDGALQYNAGGVSTWNLPISRDAVNLATSTFVIPASEVGTWAGGIPPEAHLNPDGNSYTITCWPMQPPVQENPDGTVTINVLIPPISSYPSAPPAP
ncbi:MAG TPA: hypothetical protein VJ001_04460 [Rhodocyclaceae bacterium]|nr:hypothetical protein [Rhodocyclaceae bacterium]